MAIDTSTLEATLQAKFDAVTDPKEMLLLGKAYESTVGGIAVSDIEDAGAAQVATINSVATSTFKTVGGTSILGTGDIATLPSQTGNAGKVLTTDGTNASWGDSKFIAGHSTESTTRVNMSNTPNKTTVLAFWSFTFDKQNADSDLYMNGFLSGREGSNGYAIYWWRVGTTGDSYTSWQRCGAHNYIGGYGMGEPLAGRIDTSTYPTANATGTRKVQIGFSSSSGRPFNIWNPNSIDHDEYYLGSGSIVNIFEVLP
jgi:hypothetical protein